MRRKDSSQQIPPELLESILSYLTVKSVSSFGRTNKDNHDLIHNDTKEFSQYIWKQQYSILSDEQLMNDIECETTWKHKCKQYVTTMKFVPSQLYPSSFKYSNNNRTVTKIEGSWCTISTNRIIDLRDKIGKQVIWEVTLDEFNIYQAPEPNCFATFIGFAYSLQPTVVPEPDVIAYNSIRKNEIGLACGTRRLYRGTRRDTLGQDNRDLATTLLRDGSVIRIEITVKSGKTFDVEVVENSERFPKKNIIRNVNGSFILPCCSMFIPQTLSVNRIQ
jgi:hypothetical protein